MQIVQLVGATFILAAFGAVQTARLRPNSLVPIVLNLSGASLLTISAYAAEQWGFLMLNTAWAAIAAWGLLRNVLVLTEARR